MDIRSLCTDSNGLSTEDLELKAFLEERLRYYTKHHFLEDDPVQVVHELSEAEDKVIGGFLTALICWGSRSSIVKAARQFLSWMDWKPKAFLLHASEKELQKMKAFYYRTFSKEDSFWFIKRLSQLYRQGGSLTALFRKGFEQGGVIQAIITVREWFLEDKSLPRVIKHFPHPEMGSTCKRWFLFFRWMSRKDAIDVGVWHSWLPPSELIIPLDLHVGRAARYLGILKRKTNDLKAAMLLTCYLRRLCPEDPVRYDIPLFCLSFYEGFH